MPLTEKEKFIVSFVQLTNQTTGGTLKKPMSELIEIILKQRCRKLDPEDVKNIIWEVYQELTALQGLYGDEFGIK